MVDNSFSYLGYKSLIYRTNNGLHYWGDHNTHIDSIFKCSCDVPSIRLKNRILKRKADCYACKRCNKKRYFRYEKAAP